MAKTKRRPPLKNRSGAPAAGTRRAPSTSSRRARKGGGLRRLLLWGMLAAVVVLAALYSVASLFIAAGVTKAERQVSPGTPATVGLAYQAVSFPSRDKSVALKGWYVPAEAQPGVIIVVHGLDSDKASSGTGLLDLARRLHDRGFGVFMFDLRGHGESADGKLSGGQFEQQDVLGAFDEVVRTGVPPERVGLIGFSLGGATALLAASQEPRIRAVVADSAFADVSDMIASEVPKRTSAPSWLAKALIPGLKVAARARYGIDLNSIAPVRVMPRLDYPVLLVHGTADTRIAPAHSERLKAAARDPGTQLWLVEGATHAQAFKLNPDEYVARVGDYFRGRFK